VIQDTLPPYLSDVTVTSITIGGDDATVQQFDSNKKITIPWATKDTSVTPNKFTSLYDQGAQIVITYTAKLTSTTNINAADKNTISITPVVDNDNGDKEPWEESWDDSAEITTYAAAIHKVDQDGADLDGAQFTVAGLTVEKVSDGVYRVVTYNPSSTNASAVMDTDDDGHLYILGLASDVELTVTEYKAPDGYNKLTGTKTLTPQVLEKSLYEASGTRKYDADGNLLEETATSGTSKTVERNLDELDSAALEIENNQGTLLPDTGGIGTVIFYVLGSILVIGSAIVPISRRRMENK
jgi:LPXTG-motif cell wall-anchored protein